MHNVDLQSDTSSAVSSAPRKELVGPIRSGAAAIHEIQVGLLTGGGDRHYAFGLAMGLVSNGIGVDFIGGDEVESPELHTTPKLTFFSLRRNGGDATLAKKMSRIVAYYARLIRYAATAKPKIFHILWNNKFELFDRTLLMSYYKLLRKKVVLTAHNVNAGVRDSTDSPLNRFTLKIQYRLADRIFVHTAKMKDQLLEEFSVRNESVTIIPYGVNNAVADTSLSPGEAKQRLGIRSDEKTVLFFGNIAPYKGLEYLIAAFERIDATTPNYRLVVAGMLKKGCEKYAGSIRQALTLGRSRDRILLQAEFIPDEEVELYFKAADVCVLPYTEIFQSGILFLAYSFGLPVIAADVGSLREDVVEGETGFVFRPKDAADLANTLEKYFASDLYRSLNQRRPLIRDYVRARHSWETVAHMTRRVYAELLRN